MAKLCSESAIEKKAYLFACTLQCNGRKVFKSAVNIHFFDFLIYGLRLYV